jgi:hypothetical protein
VIRRIVIDRPQHVPGPGSVQIFFGCIIRVLELARGRDLDDGQFGHRTVVGAGDIARGVVVLKGGHIISRCVASDGMGDWSSWKSTMNRVDEMKCGWSKVGQFIISEQVTHDCDWLYIQLARVSLAINNAVLQTCTSLCCRSPLAQRQHVVRRVHRYPFDWLLLGK